MSKANAVRWARAAERRGPEAPGGKICVTCETWKPFAEYWRHSGGRFGLRPQCKGCIRTGQSTWRKTPSAKAHSRRKTLSQYGLTGEQYDAMFVEQGGLCTICRRLPKGRLVVDHDHATGAVRGLLCRRCNVGLANFDEQAEIIERAGRYLKRPPDA